MSHPLVASDLAPMEAKLAADLPVAGAWQYEPKWDGFRAPVFRDGDNIELMSKAGKPLGRYFPELVEALRTLRCSRFVLDGEIILPVGEVLSFDALQARLHPAQSRIDRLSRETPAQLMLFDCLRDGDRNLATAALDVRRAALEAFHAGHGGATLLLSPCTDDLAVARAWLARSGGALDGVVAKRRDEAYRFGERAMVKVKQHRSADCVVGGFRRGEGGDVASLLLGLYDAAGALHHVGFTSALAVDERHALLETLEPLIEAPGFTGKAPGGPSRWSNGKDQAWEPLRAELVVEVLYDQVTGQRFRHGTKVLRWRPDKLPRQCGMDQLVRELRPAQLGTL